MNKSKTALWLSFQNLRTDDLNLKGQMRVQAVKSEKEITNRGNNTSQVSSPIFGFPMLTRSENNSEKQ